MGRNLREDKDMSTFLDAIAKLEGKFVEVGTQGEWSDKGQIHSVGQDHLVLLQPNSDRLIVVKIAALEYIKELPVPGGGRVTGRSTK